jgi:hypothetical protein
MIRFLADADLNQAIVARLCAQRINMDFLSANEANLEGVFDAQVLALAANQDRFSSRMTSEPCRDTW